MQDQALETFYPTSQKEWRTWLEKNHVTKQSIWLVQYKVKSGVPTLSWSEAVDEALCFGWIDSTRKSIDQDKFIQFFCKRKPKSAWSKINKMKLEKLIEEGMMTEAGLESIAIAKQNGSWTILDEVEELIIPHELAKAFLQFSGSEDFFMSRSKSTKKHMLQWIAQAKRPETKEKRCLEIAELAARQLKPKQF
ncbi:MAG: YdeI/OmpD-associated family protein [Bacteroidia bacterium]